MKLPKSVGRSYAWADLTLLILGVVLAIPLAYRFAEILARIIADRLVDNGF